ncbi:MAG: hypothetical protein JETT_2314 [Candidatus Jettenia ecosi]|uniref:Uncharacterized protein n=1 Tax=Candidatus Jettenia ecosi TaxID=2494326 RepID=A0A533Q9U0_9BACT|nr:MAG: hypothetical protein JETT_2314 [Candidatus Jettenia ecosi]
MFASAEASEVEVQRRSLCLTIVLNKLSCIAQPRVRNRRDSAKEIMMDNFLILSPLKRKLNGYH